MTDPESDSHRFDFDLDRGIRDQVVQAIEASPELQLTRNVGPDQSGVYGLYYKGKLVYIGKASKGTTKSKRSLRSRLNEHIGKIEKRRNISIEEIRCRYLTFESEWWVFAAEFALMAHYEPEWNQSGFGSKTPGRGRPGTDRISAWDQQFPPIDQ